jgi:hypothetical protein
MLKEGYIWRCKFYTVDTIYDIVIFWICSSNNQL